MLYLKVDRLYLKDNFDDFWQKSSTQLSLFTLHNFSTSISPSTLCVFYMYSQVQHHEYLQWETDQKWTPLSSLVLFVQQQWNLGFGISKQLRPNSNYSRLKLKPKWNCIQLTCQRWNAKYSNLLPFTRYFSLETLNLSLSVLSQMINSGLQISQHFGNYSSIRQIWWLMESLICDMCMTDCCHNISLSLILLNYDTYLVNWSR